MYRYSIPTLCVLILAGALLFPGKSDAAASMSNDAIRVSPAISNLQLQSTQATATITATITNLATVPLSVALSSRDFGALNETGTVGFYGNAYNPGENPHALANAMSFPTPTVYLPPHGSQQVTIALNGLTSLAAGGHFGAALFTPQSPLASSGKPNVSLRSSVASLIFLTTASGGTQSLQLLSFHVGALSFSLPSLNYIGFHNSGNTQSTVRGQLTLYGPGGNIVNTTVVNPGSGLVLPGTSRVFPVTLPLPNTTFARPGIYQMKLQYRENTQNTFMTVNERFYYINLIVFVPIVLFIILIIYASKWHGKKALKTSRHVARRSVHVIKHIARKKTAPQPSEPPKKRKARRIQG